MTEWVNWTEIQITVFQKPSDKEIYLRTEIKRYLFLGRKPMTNPDCVLKSRDITSPTKGCIIKTLVFPVFMYRCWSWTIKKAEPWRTYDFELWCWRRLLRFPWTARRSNQSILKEIIIGRTDAKAPILWLPDVKNWLIGKDPDGEKNRGWDGWMASLTWWTWVWASSGSWWWTGKPGVLQSMGLQRVRHGWVTELKWSQHCLLISYIPIQNKKGFLKKEKELSHKIKIKTR